MGQEAVKPRITSTRIVSTTALHHPPSAHQSPSTTRVVEDAWWGTVGEGVDEPGRVVDHCCEPNVALRPNEHGAYDFVTLRPVDVDEELYFDYESTEAKIVTFSECRCGAASRRGRVVGYEK